MDKLIEFMKGPLPYPGPPAPWRSDTGCLELLPGCGAAGIAALNAADIYTLHQFAGKFMAMDRDTAAFIAW